MKGLARGLVVTATLTAALFTAAGVSSADIGWPVAPAASDSANGHIGWPVAPGTDTGTDGGTDGGTGTGTDTGATPANGHIGWPVAGA